MKHKFTEFSKAKIRMLKDYKRSLRLRRMMGIGQYDMMNDHPQRHKSGDIRRVGWLLATQPPVKAIGKILAMQPVLWKCLSR